MTGREAVYTALIVTGAMLVLLAVIVGSIVTTKH